MRKDINLYPTIRRLNEIQNWPTNNNLLLNHTKTELLNITNDPNTYFPDIIINPHKIIPTNSVKNRGVNFNKNLIWINITAYLLNLQLHSYLILIKYDHT